MTQKDNSEAGGCFWQVPAKMVKNDNPTKAALYGLVLNTSDSEGRCTKSNKFFANQLGLEGGSTVSNYITQLVESGWLRRKLKGGNQRVLKVPFVADSNVAQSNANGSNSPDTHTPREQRGDLEQGGSKNNNNKNKKNNSKKIKKEKEKGSSAGAAPSNKSASRDETHPKEIFNRLLDEYQRLKGIDLQGDEYGKPQNYIKKMLNNGRNPDDIVELMIALEESDEVWTNNWQMSTVYKKIAEWVGGSLDLGLEEKSKRVQDTATVQEAKEADGSILANSVRFSRDKGRFMFYCTDGKFRELRDQRVSIDDYPNKLYPIKEAQVKALPSDDWEGWKPAMEV